jgi:hypothetical protein
VPEAVRRLTPTGIERFRGYLRALREGSVGGPPRSLLTDPDTSEPFRPDRSVEPRALETRLDVGRYLCRVFDGCAALEDDIGLWSWLSLFFFDEVCPAGPDGRRSPGRDYRHILEPGYRYGHRHLLGGAFLVYRLHGERAALLLCTKPHVENRFHHELASRQMLISNAAIIEAASLLYLDARTGRPKRGAQDPKRSLGTLLRFVDVLQQLDVNYDLYGMTAEALVALLPAEFDRWRPKKRRWWPGGKRMSAISIGWCPAVPPQNALDRRKGDSIDSAHSAALHLRAECHRGRPKEKTV